ncbi:MAG: ribonucleotide-diphosphate reductase subunit beta [Intestinibacter bartlettii]
MHKRYSKIFQKKNKKSTNRKVMDVFDRLMENEINYTNTIYEGTGLADEVINFLKYNANRAMENLGYDNRLEVDPVNPIVLNGLSTETKTHDFFSTKGNGYPKECMNRYKIVTLFSIGRYKFRGFIYIIKKRPHLRISLTESRDVVIY